MSYSLPAIPPAHQDAAGIIERLINNRLFGNPQQPQFLDVKAAVGVGLEYFYNRGDGNKQQETLRITLTDPHIETAPAQVRDHVLKILSETPLKDAVNFGTNEERAIALKKKLEEFIANGADIPKNYLEWRGFSADLKEGKSPEDHAIREIGSDDFGVHFSIRVPPTNSDDKSAMSGIKQVEANLHARLPQIKQVLTERIIKYSGQLNDAQKQQLTATVNQLDVKTATMESEYFNDVTINIVSPQQKVFADLDRNQRQGANTQGLAATNPLSALSKEHLGKALGRSFLHGGEAADAIFPLIAGGEDMQRSIIKSLNRLKAAKPGLSTEVDTFLNDDTFKSRESEKRSETKAFPDVKKDPAKPGEMTIDFTMPPGKAETILQQIAALQNAGQAVSAPVFGQVDHVHIIGTIPAQQINTAPATPTVSPDTLLKRVVQACGCGPQAAMQ